MKRLSFLATLFGVGAAGQTQKCIPPSSTVTMPNGKRVCLAPGGAEPHIYMNNECPTCGTMAEPYKRPIRAKGEMMPMECHPEPASATPSLGYSCLAVVRFYQEDTPYGPMDRVTRCKRCNAAFWQDAKDKPNG